MQTENPYRFSIQAMEATEVAEMLAKQLEEATVVYHPYGENFTVSPDLLSRGVATVRGKLNLSHQDIVTRVSAEIMYTVCADWISQNPRLRCREKWFLRLPKADADWHIYRDGTICYALRREWSDYLHVVAKSQSLEAAKLAAVEYCLNSSRWLLYRYVDAYRRKLTTWDSRWEAWSHNAKGEREYLNHLKQAA